MDTLQVERDRGITVKAQTASMIFRDDRTNKEYLLNLIDTPGHIDFSYEVSRSLASCQGALLLVDSSQSIQAQTLANHAKAKELGLGTSYLLKDLRLGLNIYVFIVLNWPALFCVMFSDSFFLTLTVQCSPQMLLPKSLFQASSLW